MFILVIFGIIGYVSKQPIFSNWFPYILGILFYFMAIKLLLKRKKSKISNALFQNLIIVWIFFLGFSLFLGEQNILGIVPTLRDYMSFWGLMIFLAYTQMSPDGYSKLWKAFISIVFLQVPLVIAQHFVYAKNSTYSTSWDAVVGSFGGNPDGGGNSAGLAFFVVIVLLLVIDLYRKKLITSKKRALVFISTFIIIILAEIKAVFILIPLGLLILFRAEILKKPMKSMMFSLLLIICFYLIFYVYANLYNSKEDDISINEYVEYIIDSYSNSEYGQKKYVVDDSTLTRVSALVYWFDMHNEYNYGLVNSFIGHGIGSSKYTGKYATTIAQKLGYRLNRTGISMLLWDVGILGLTLYLFILLNASWMSIKLSTNKQIPTEHQVYLNIGGVALFLLVAVLFYKNSPLTNSIFLSLTALFLGQIIYWRQRVIQ